MTSSLDFQVVQDAVQQSDSVPATVTELTASDGERLAVRVYRCPKNKQAGKKKASVIFYHGGGAHSGATYQLLGHGLANSSLATTVYTPDLRGHGASGGARGDAPSPEQVWRDIDTVLKFVAETESKETSIFLGGHSSGAGLLLNYITEHEGDLDPSISSRLKGYILVSPQLGYKAEVDRPLQPNTPPFAKVNIPAFIGNAITGWWGHFHAVQFTYPSEILENDPGMVKSNTVNMANAITPVDPHTQVKATDLPLKLWIGKDDELFLADKVASFAAGKPNLSNSILPNQTHLGIIVDIHSYIEKWIKSQL